LFVAATQNPRAVSLLLGHSVRQAVSTCIISTKGCAAALPGQTVCRAPHAHRGVALDDVTIIAPDFVVSEIHRRAVGADGRPLGQRPMQEAHIMSAQDCAQLIVAAMRPRRRMLITSARGRLGRWARLTAPGLLDALAARAIRERR
jgi:hypothetical protein